MLQDYVPVAILFLASLAVAVGGIFLSSLLGPRSKRPAPEKLLPYESGMLPVGPARRRFAIKFYLIAVLFILFDIEVVFMYPWAVVFRELLASAGIIAFIEMLVFVGVLLIGLFYLWKKGALEWE